VPFDLLGDVSLEVLINALTSAPLDPVPKTLYDKKNRFRWRHGDSAGDTAAIHISVRQNESHRFSILLITTPIANTVGVKKPHLSTAT
jgi:hypothetical protein